MKKIIPFVLILAFALIPGIQCSAAAAEGEYTSSRPLTLYPAYLQTPMGMPVLLDAVTDPAGGSLLWWSSDPSVAIVDEEGCVTPVSPGETVITCLLMDEPYGFAECGVLVVAEGKILLWEFPPEQIDLDAIFAEIEEEAAANPPEAPEVSWPEAWPDDLPKVDGKVITAGGDLSDSTTGLYVVLTIQEIDIVKAYVDELIALGLKGSPMDYDGGYLAQLTGKGYTEIMVSYTASEQQCFVSVKK
jgi:hypothetical protein